MPSCASFLKPRKSRFGSSKSRFNTENFIHSFSLSISIDLEMCLTARNCQKIHKNPYFGIQSYPVIEFGCNQEPVYDYLLVINRYLCLISHHYWDTATYWLKITNFSYPLSFSTLDWGDPFKIYGKVLRFLKLESSRQPTVKIWWS